MNLKKGPIIGAAVLTALLIAMLGVQQDVEVDTSTFILPSGTSQPTFESIAAAGSTEAVAGVVRNSGALTDSGHVARPESSGTIRERAMAEAMLDRYRAEKAIVVLDKLGLAGDRREMALRARSDAERREAAASAAAAGSDIQMSGERVRVVARPILRSSLPLSVSDRLPPALDRTNDVVPSYRDATASPGDALDLAESDFAPVSGAILRKASELDHDYIRILDFVRREVRMSWYAGGMQGGEYTLKTRQGNDVDQAALLIGLLRASNVPARFVTGVAEVPIASVREWMGVDDAQVVVDVLARAGVPHEPVYGATASDIVAVQLEHTWVTAYVPYGNYRGSAGDLSNRTWIALAPSLVHQQILARIDPVGDAQIDMDGLVRSYLEEDVDVSPVARLKQEIGLYLADGGGQTTLEDLLIGPEITSDGFRVLPASLPFREVSVRRESPTVDAERLHELSVRVIGSSGDTVMDQRVPTYRLLGQHGWFEYIPSAIEDFNLVREYGGLHRVPAYLVRLRPRLSFGDAEPAAGVGELAMGEVHQLEIGLDNGLTQRTFTRTVIAGNRLAVTLTGQWENPISGGEETPILHRFGQHYVQRWNSADQDAAALLNVQLVRPLPALVVTAAEFRVDEVGGLAQSLELVGVNVDAATRITSAVGPDDRARQFLALSGMEGSYWESQLFDDLWDIRAISADRGLRELTLAGGTVLSIDEDSADIVGSLGHPQPVLDSVTDWISRGMTVEIPGGLITKEEWTGSVWRVTDPQAGGSGYFISGGLAGGENVEPPENWEPGLISALGFPYAPSVNDNPGDVVQLFKLPSTDGQLVPVGEELPQPLTVRAFDVIGRPVEGVEIEFKVTSGVPEPVTIEATTDRDGIATATYTIPESTSIEPRYLQVSADDVYPQQVNRMSVDAKVKDADTNISLLFPFSIFGVPRDPAEILLGGHLMKGGIRREVAGSLAFRVVDEFNNPVSSVPVRVEALHPTLCGLSEAPLDAEPARFFPPGSCDYPPIGNVDIASEPLCGDFSDEVYPSLTVGDTKLLVVNGDGPVRNPGSILEAHVEHLTYQYPIRLSAPGLADVTTHSGGYSSINTANCDDGVNLSGGFYFPLFKIVDPVFFNTGGAGFQVLGEATERSLPLRYGRVRPDLSSPTGIRLEGIPDDLLPPRDEYPLSIEYFDGNQTQVLSPAFGTDTQRTETVESLVFPPQTEPGAFVPNPRIVNFGTSGGLVTNVPSAWEVENEAFMREPVLYTLDVAIDEEAPIRIPTDTATGILNEDLAISYRVEPEISRWVVLLRMKKGDDVVQSWLLTPREPVGEVVLAKGSYIFDPESVYSFDIVIEPGTQYEYVSPHVEASVSESVLRAMRTDEEEAPAGGPVVNGNLLRSISLFHDVDLPNDLVCANENVELDLSKDARITFTLHRLDELGERTGDSYEVLTNELLSAGVHEAEVAATDLGTGQFEIEVVADPADGAPPEVTRGGLSSSFILRNTLPVGHSIVKGVDLANGSYAESAQDISIPGLNGGLSLSRTYSSSRRQTPGALGFGWVHNHMSRVIRGRCGQWTVTGTDGGSMTFLETLDGFEPLKGYHGTLLRTPEDGGFDFFAKSGKRYHYTQRQDRTWWLDYTEDTNGNRTEIRYRASETPLISEIIEPAGRRLRFSYALRNFSRYTREVITEVTGPDDIRVQFTYNDAGHLVAVERENGSTRTEYGYTLFDAYDVLTQVRDALSGAQRSIDYSEHGLEVGATGGGSYAVPSAAVERVTEPDGGDVEFSYTLGAWGSNETAVVIDARGFPTTYTMDDYGAAEVIEAPQGIRRYEWNTTTDVLLMAEIDENGRRVEYEYDEYGNRTQESVGSHQRRWTYFAPDAFSHTGIKNRVEQAVDWRGIATDFDYDGRGNRIEEHRDNVTVRHSYNDIGLRVATTDGRNNTMTYVHDALGYPLRMTDALGNVTRMIYDERGRVTRQTDANGDVTDIVYDDRDREIERTTQTPIIFEGPDLAIRTLVEYDDEARIRRETDARGNTTVYEHDVMGRLVRVTNALNDSRVMTYDFNGNMETDTDFEGRLNSYVYDGANRLERKTEPLGRISTYEYDDVGNLTAEETNGRRTEYDYDPDRYFQTVIRRPEGQTVQREYDGNGNVTVETDPLGRVATTTYDDFDRPENTDGPLGSGVRRTYDENGNLLREVILLGNNVAGGEQIRAAQFDALNRRIVATDATGGATTWTYDPVGNVTRVVGPRQETTVATFNAFGWALSSTQQYDGQSSQTAFAFDENGNAIGEVWPNGNAITRSFDVLNRRVSESDSVGAIGAWTYDAVGNVLTETDGNGNVATHTYNALNQRTGSDLPEDRSLSWTYTVFNEVLTETDARSNTLTHTVDNLGRRLTTTGPENLSQSMTYDAANNLLTQTDSRDTVITNTYNDLNQRVTESITGSGSGRTWTRSFTYDAVGNLLREVDRRGIETVMTYDAENRSLTTTRADERKEERRYDLSGNLTTRLDANGNPVTYEYDRRNLVIRESRPELQVTNYTRDAMGDVLVEDLPGPAALTRTYDLRRRMETETNAATESMGYEYDLNNNQVAKTTAKNQRWTYAFDDANRLFQITDPLSHVTTYGYDGNSNMTSLTDANDHVSTYTYDARNRRTEKSYPDTSRVFYEYDTNDNLTEVRHPNGTTSTFSYDALNQLVNEEHSGNGELINVEFTLDDNGNPTLVDQTGDDALGAASNRYDADNRPERMVDLFGRTMDLVYDPQGNPTTLRDFVGQVETRSYDTLNRLKTLGYAGVGTYAFTYGINGRVESMEGPSGAISTYSYDAANRVTDIHHTQASATVARIQYVYDDNGNRTEERLTNGAGERLTTYEYDDADRLIRITTPEDQATYTIDGAGNRLTEIVTVGGIQTENKVYSYDNRDRLQTIADSISGDTQTFDFDEAGNQISQTIDGVTTDFDYTVRNRIKTVTVQGAPPIAYEYNHRGLRMAKEQSGTRTQSVYDHTDNLCGRTNALGNLLERHVRAGSRLLGTLQSGSTTHHLNDALGTPIAALTTLGTVAGRYRYDAWGEVEEQSGQAPTFGFTGYELNPDTDGYYAQQRYYQPQTGRFNTIDPVEGQLMVPMSYHRYLYGYANPTVFVDPDGRCSYTLVAGLGPAAPCPDSSFIAEESLNPELARARNAERARLSAIMRDEAGAIIGAALHESAAAIGDLGVAALSSLCLSCDPTGAKARTQRRFEEATYFFTSQGMEENVQNTSDLLFETYEARQAGDLDALIRLETRMGVTVGLAFAPSKTPSIVNRMHRTGGSPEPRLVVESDGGIDSVFESQSTRHDYRSDRASVDPVSGETEATALGKQIHRNEAERRRQEGMFSIVAQAITAKDGAPIHVPKRIDLRSGQPILEKGTQEAIPDAAIFDRGLLIDDKPMGRPLSKDRQEIIRFIEAFREREGVLPTTIAIQRYDSSTGEFVRTDLHSSDTFLPKTED